MIEIQQTTSELVRPDVGKDLFVIYNLVGAASFFSIGVQPGISGATVLCYPVLSFFLACVWRQHNNRIKQINSYLLEVGDSYLEQIKPGGWERYRQYLWKKSKIGLVRFTTDPQAIAMFVFLIIADLLAMMMTIIVLGIDLHKIKKVRLVWESLCQSRADDQRQGVASDD